MTRHAKCMMTMLLLALSVGACFATGTMVHLNFRESPLFQVVEFYEYITGNTVTVETGKYPVVTLESATRLSVPDTIALIETYCASNGIIFTKNDRGVFISPDPTKMPSDAIKTVYSPPQRSNQNLRPAMAGSSNEDHHATATSAPKQFTPEEVRKHLLDYNKALIDAGLPPIPMEAITNNSEAPTK